MRRQILLMGCFSLMALASLPGQALFDVEIAPEFGAKEIRVSPMLTTQVIFIGGVDMVQTTDTYGNPAGEAPAKQWHDFIGFTGDESGESLGWVSINHERIVQDDLIGDGGGMTVFKIAREGDSIVVVDQTLADGRSGKYFNVDFVNTVGPTGMNCGGIVSEVGGRIWTAEEWFRTSNSSIDDRDTSDFVIGTGTVDGQTAPVGFPGFDGEQIKKYQNYNYMVEIDPREAVALRKQYNWGRAGFEGGAVLPDNKTVYLGIDATPAPWAKFVAETENDFTTGKLYVYKHDADEKWIEIDNTVLDNMLNFSSKAWEVGATMYNRIEWVAYDPVSGKVYATETGRDNPGSRWAGELEDGGVFAPHHIDRASAQGVADPAADEYVDYYGRVVEFDPATEEMVSFLEGGPDIAEADATVCDYPITHLSNPDGLHIKQIGDKSYMVIQEDLNGDTYGRTPLGTYKNFASRIRTCEFFLLDMQVEDPTLEDLVRIGIVPFGAEVTGARFTDDGETLLINSQHPSDENPFPYNNSLTLAISGFGDFLGGTTPINELNPATIIGTLNVRPNPTADRVMFDRKIDAAIYDMSGKRLQVYRNVNEIDLSAFTPSTYFLRTEDGETAKIVLTN
ncbi:MAG: DUF839 domain-containing protein [Saprospiraceae bacterium]|nr:DUF839 domain-containing protein [Saprospiraceae bacterium]